MKKIIENTKRTFQDDWNSVLENNVFLFEIINHKIFNILLNIFLIVIIILEFLFIQNPIFKFLLCLLTLFVFVLGAHFVEGYIYFIARPRKIKKIENDINLLDKYIIKLKKELKKIEETTYAWRFSLELRESDYEKSLLLEKIEIYEVLLEQKTFELKEQIRNENKEKELSKNDKENIQIIDDIIYNLENQKIPSTFNDKIDIIINLSKNLLDYVKRDPTSFKYIIKTYNIYINELSNVLKNIEKLESEDQKSYYANIDFVADKLIEHVQNLINSLEKREKDNISLSLKILGEELSNEKGDNLKCTK